MKIGIVCYPTFGGSGVVATELGMALAQKGHEVHFITYNQPFRLDGVQENIYYHEVRIANYPLFDYAPYELALTSKMVDVVKYEGLQLLHVHYAIPHASAAYMAKQILADENIHIPYITTLHGTDITLVGKDLSFKPVITFAINQSNAVTAVSQSLKDDTYDLFHVKTPIKVIPNFICPSDYTVDFDVQEVKQKYAPNGERIIMHISNFRKVKRVEDVVKTFAKVVEQQPAKLVLVGDGPERWKIEQLCRELGTCAHTKFVGKIKGVEKILHIADAFLLPSETESFGLAALEAMAAGVPVISTNTGGLPEVNTHGVTGFLHDIGDVQGMADSILTIFDNPELEENLKQNCLQRAHDFSIGNILPMYEQLYEETLATNLQMKG